MIAKNDQKVNMKRRKQNHKISFHFFAGSPHTPRRKWIGKEIFGFDLRPKGARGAHCSLHHAIGAYDLGSSYHALRACEVSRFATGKKFGFRSAFGAKLYVASLLPRRFAPRQADCIVFAKIFWVQSPPFAKAKRGSPLRSNG